MEVKREEVLRKLENAIVAVTTNAILEQSDTYVFKDGKLVTFDGEILTRQESPFDTEIEGSIIAGDFLKVLQRFPDETLQVRRHGGELIIKGRRRSAGIKMMADVLLPYEDIPIPKKWREWPEGLRDALMQAITVCGKDETVPKTTHVHIAQDRVEASDSFRVLRIDIKTGLRHPILVHAMSLVNACKYDLKKMSVSKGGWFHVATSDDMTMSLLCSADEYYKVELIDRLLNVEGEEVTLPSNLPDILSRAEVMDTPNLSIGGWDSKVTISLHDNVLRVTSRKEEGWFRETKKVRYDGPELTFSIHPTFLKELVGQTRKVIISNRQIKVDAGNIHFTAALEFNKGE